MCQQPNHERITNAEVEFQPNESLQLGKVKGRSAGPDSKVCMCHNDKPILRTITCDGEFTDGLVREYAVNFISKNLVSRVDYECFSKEMLRSITSLKKDHTAVN